MIPLHCIAHLTVHNVLRHKRQSRHQKFRSLGAKAESSGDENALALAMSARTLKA